MVVDAVHVYPVGDLIEHEVSEDCVCGPDVSPVERRDGSIGYVIRHHSLDGREIREAERLRARKWDI